MPTHVRASTAFDVCTFGQGVRQPYGGYENPAALYTSYHAAELAWAHWPSVAAQQSTRLHFAQLSQPLNVYQQYCTRPMAPTGQADAAAVNFAPRKKRILEVTTPDGQKVVLKVY